MSHKPLTPTPEERERFFRELDAQIIQTQREAPANWSAELAERRQFDGTLLDGLADDPWEGQPPPTGTTPLPEPPG